MNYYLGVDIGSVSSNFVFLDENRRLVKKVYLRTQGNPVQAIKNGYRQLCDGFDHNRLKIRGVGTTGSGRHLAAVLIGADTVKNEITAHAIASSSIYPDVRTILEIGGQDSKIICLRQGIVHDFAMNTVCAAGTGSFLDQQASRLNLPIEQFGTYATASRQPVRIAGRCGVFAESDMIHKQQMGYPVEDIIMGLCEALVRNYLSNVAKGKKIEQPVVFQGGVAANTGIRSAFQSILGMPIQVPEDYDVMGAVGAALLAQECVMDRKSSFKGNDYIMEGQFTSSSQECKGCPNMCEVVCIKRGPEILAYWGDRCKKWETSLNRGLQELKVV
ncbi:MAG TPA: acyl-CoA dehydratase activase [Syntrophomonadaceae bacterium]|nr:acyl-CoA dehydratase activase [Syntrophomonadaceae bacterium]